MTDSINVLTAAFNNLKQYNGTTFVIQCSGFLLENDDLLKSFAEDVSSLHNSGVRIIIIHDGSNIVHSIMEKFSLKGSAANLNNTSQPNVEIVEMVLTGHVNQKIVTYITQAEGSAAGISGKDGEFMLAKRAKLACYDYNTNEKVLNFGFIGELSMINPDILFSLDDNGLIPVISPIALGEDGRTYKIDPSDISGAIASVLGAKKLIFVSDSPGIIDEQGQTLYEINKSYLSTMINFDNDKIGLSSHLRSALMALEHDTETVHILNGKIPNVIMRDLFTDELVGTTIKA
jgi:acetylglutamate kinase